MHANHEEIVAAARTLVEWARTRQASWHDPSADLIAALGDRHRTLIGDGAGQPAAMAQWPPYSGAAPVPPPPPPSAAPLDTPSSPTSAVPIPAGTAPSIPSAPVPQASRTQPPVPHRRSGRTSAGWTARAAAVCVALAAVAAPAVWRAYRPTPVVAPAVGTIALDSTPGGSTVFIDGVEVGKTPLLKELSTGPHAVEFRQKKRSRKVEVIIVGGQETASSVDWTRKATGRIAVTSAVANTTVLVDGKGRGIAPLTIDDLAVGSHTVVLQSKQGSIKRVISVKESETARLEGSFDPGLLHVHADFELQVSEAGRPITLDQKNQTQLAPGAHKLRFANVATGLVDERTIEIAPAAVTSVTIEPGRQDASPDLAATSAEAPPETPTSVSTTPDP